MALRFFHRFEITSAISARRSPFVRRTRWYHTMEIDVSRQRYSESQILFGLREAWQEFTGVNDPFDAETLIYTFMKSDGSWDELDFADIFYGIERFFGFQCSDKEWTDFFGFNAPQRGLEEWKQTVAPNLTFGSLARFIAERAPVIASFDPITVFGRLCGWAVTHLLPKQLENHGIKPEQFTITPSALEKLVASYTREAGVRNLERELAGLTRKGTKEILMGTIKVMNLSLIHI